VEVERRTWRKWDWVYREGFKRLLTFVLISWALYPMGSVLRIVNRMFHTLYCAVPATRVRLACCAASDNTHPQPGWRRPRGRRRTVCLQQIWADLNRRACDTLNFTFGRNAWQSVATSYDYYYYYYYYYYCGDLSDAITQNVTGALYTSPCRDGHMSVTQQHN